MSLRAQLKSAVASCTPYDTQHATFHETDATGHATGMQQMPANPHKQRVSDATGHATAMQPGVETDATSDIQGGRLRVAFAKARNLQPTAEELTQQLLGAAMAACDHHGDGPEAREQMRRECMETPPHLRADLLDHFRKAYRGRQ